jgi:hypothetical protein
MLTERVIQTIAENKTQAAIEAGEFDNLPGLGQPAAIFDEPYDPQWWIRRKLKRESLTLIMEERFNHKDQEIRESLPISHSEIINDK